MSSRCSDHKLLTPLVEFYLGLVMDYLVGLDCDRDMDFDSDRDSDFDYDIRDFDIDREVGECTELKDDLCFRSLLF